jgi:hypothetical protein
MTEKRQGKRDLEKERYWRNQIASWRISGLSQTAFCRQENLNFHTFSSWTYIIRDRDEERRQLKGRTTQRRVKQSNKKTDARRSSVPGKTAAVQSGNSGNSTFVKAIIEDDDHASVQMVNESTPQHRGREEPSAPKLDERERAQRVAAELYGSKLGSTLRIYDGADLATISAVIADWSSC